MAQAKYGLVGDTPEAIIIRDLGPWDRHPTVTNDAPAVVAQLARRLQGRRLFYFDSEGDLDEILVRDGKFCGFSPYRAVFPKPGVEENRSPATSEPAPKHPFEVTIQIGASDWPEVLRVVTELAIHLEQHGPECNQISGGFGGCHSVHVERREISAADYRNELSAWHGRTQRTKGQQ